MNGGPRRLVAIGLGVLVLVGVLAGIVLSVKDKLAAPTVALQGLIGSEKADFFADPRVIAALRRGGFSVTVATAGSRQIASMDLSKQDFVFPAGAPAAEKIRRDHPGTTSSVPFFTPMAIATWKPIVDILTTAGVASNKGTYTAFDVAAYMKLVASDTRWKDLAGNTAYAVNKSVLVTSTDVRKSNSAAMYLALVSYVANGNNIVENDSQVAALMGRISPVFLKQGYVENSSDAPFEDYLVQGMGKSPMVMIYESQFVQRAAAGDGSITPDMALMYPAPTILSKHTFVSLTPDGARLGQFIATDPEMRTLATQFGFRTTDTTAFRTFVADHKLAIPDSLLDVIDPPTFETLESMIGQLEIQYAGGSSGSTPTPAP